MNVILRRFLPALLAIIAALGFASVIVAGAVAPPRRSAPPVVRAQNHISDSAAFVHPTIPPAARMAIGEETVTVRGRVQRTFRLTAGEVVEISAHIERPSVLPANGRLSAVWRLEGAAAQAGDHSTTLAPTDWRKVLSALDPDVFVVYRAPRAGSYTLVLDPVVDETDIGEENARWREKGAAAAIFPLPSHTAWPASAAASVRISVRTIDAGDARAQAEVRTIIECEPNDTPDLAQAVQISGVGQTWEITGGADDVEFFDNGKVGKSGEDWFRVEYSGTAPCLLTAQLAIPGQSVVAGIRCYQYRKVEGAAPLLIDFIDGQNPNERAHQQDESYRTNITRLIKPGQSYLLRVEANAPGYQLQLRTIPPAPYTDPVLAIRQGMYQHIGQVDAWLTNRPRGASVERRIRDSGNLLGTQCMSCHTQSGVWGPSGPIAAGYRVESPINFWHMIDVMYECLRPTNELKDAANNTSLAPLDLGDGPAGTRAAGFNIINAEHVRKPSKLHAHQQLRTANYVLQTSDPGGINAAGPGSNVGQAIVLLFAAEILKRAWEATDDPRYYRALEDRAREMLFLKPQYTDDVAVRLDFFGRLFPSRRMAAEAARAADRETALGLKSGSDPGAALTMAARVDAQMAEDTARLKSIQNDDGSWGFNPGTTSDEGKTWTPTRGDVDPSPTALAVNGLISAGLGKTDPTVSRGVKSLLAMQEPYGRWNKAAQTGFVTSAYAMRALARLYPAPKDTQSQPDLHPKRGETLLQTIRRVRMTALTGDAAHVPALVSASNSPEPLVRYWALIGLGAAHSQTGIDAVIAALSDRTKLVREAAVWALRQSLLDDVGWSAASSVFAKGDDHARSAVVEALSMRADAAMTKSKVDWPRLESLFDTAINRDRNPAVRAWAARAAWQWWVWNPPIRAAINRSWFTMLTRPEENAVVEASNRYSSQALFIANGHKANGSREQQYKELAPLFATLTGALDAQGDRPLRDRLAARLVAIGGTFYQTSGADGGPGQMGYATPGAAEMMGKASLAYLSSMPAGSVSIPVRAGLEGAANVPYRPLTDFLVNYSLQGPEELRQVAAAAVSDPRSVTLAAVPELIQPQMAQVRRGAMEPPRRPQVSDPVLELWSKVNWSIPKTEEQQRAFFDIMIPKFDVYKSEASIAAMPDAAVRTAAARESDANWYLADRLGDVLRTNPDLHIDIVALHYFPDHIANPLQERYWIQNVEWLLSLESTRKAPATVAAPAGNTVRTAALQTQPPPAPDPIESARDRALQLYLDALKPTADPKTRAIAIRMANQTALRTNPEVLRALEAALQTETDKELRVIITSALKQSSGRFLSDLKDALKAEHNPAVLFDAAGEPKLSDVQEKDIIYFRDFVMPELNRQKRTDQQACMGCHGKPGRVPSLELHAPDKYGFSTAADLLANYRLLQKRVSLNDIEKSKLLRKPLNIQDGKEDGHQGGRRYNPTDPGYLIIRKWVDNQPEVQKTPRDGSVIRGPKSGSFGHGPGVLVGRNEFDCPTSKTWGIEANPRDSYGTRPGTGMA